MKVGENEYVEFHVDYNTRYIDRLLQKVDNSGISLSDHKCYYAIGKKDDICEYVVMDANKEPVLIHSSSYEMECAILAYRFELAEKLDIRTMAETREVPRVV